MSMQTKTGIDWFFVRDNLAAIGYDIGEVFSGLDCNYPNVTIWDFNHTLAPDDIVEFCKELIAVLERLP